MFLRYFIIFFCCYLSGCTAPFMMGTAVGGTVSGVVASDRRSVNIIAEDRNIHYQADLRLKSTSRLKHCRVVVSVFNHVVLLAGQVQTGAQRQLAQKIVADICGVKHIYNKIEIGTPLTPMQQSQDAWITAKVVGNMLKCADLNATQIKVVTENRTVYFMGIVTRHQAYAAGEIAKRVSGVKCVVKLFEYANIPHG